MMTSIHSNMLYQPANNRGTTLTEILVVMVILCTGMITIAGMLNESINSLASSLYQQQAVLLSSDLAETLSSLPADKSWPSIMPADYHCQSITCTPEELFASTMHHWQQRVARQLPAGRGTIESAEQNGQATTLIQIEWQARGGTAAKSVLMIPVAAITKPI
jgi:Tfp pilus assembly protein PilV